MQEIWKDIPQFEGKYQASSLGRIMSLNYLGHKGKTQIRKTYSGQGYEHIMVMDTKGKKRFLGVHVLVAMAFLNHIPDGNNLVVDHIDKNPLNNNLSNLRILPNGINSNKDRKRKYDLPMGIDIHQKSGKYRARCGTRKQPINVGLFHNLEDAIQALNKTKEQPNLC